MVSIVTPQIVPATDWLLNQIAARNPDIIAPLTSQNVGFGLPVPMTPPAGGFAVGAPNTQLTLTPALGTGYIGVATVYYPRVDLGALFATAAIAALLVDTAITTWAELNTAINARYGTHLTDVDSPLYPLPDLNTVGVVTYTVNPSSLLYTGTLAIAITTPDLATAFTVTTLTGLA